ncbi:hypothetical protein DFH11DRAFT_1877138 [Phellopilus nigrolimitatus]|nr:hypothetical protein DFH11DRAFT_1877138 [Phellopilus nigrolimitatus]
MSAIRDESAALHREMAGLSLDNSASLVVPPCTRRRVPARIRSKCVMKEPIGVDANIVEQKKTRTRRAARKSRLAVDSSTPSAPSSPSQSLPALTYDSTSASSSSDGYSPPSSLSTPFLELPATPRMVTLELPMTSPSYTSAAFAALYDEAELPVVALGWSTEFCMSVLSKKMSVQGGSFSPRNALGLYLDHSPVDIHTSLRLPVIACDDDLAPVINNGVDACIYISRLYL